MIAPQSIKPKYEKVTVSELATSLINIVNSHVDQTDPKSNPIMEEDESEKPNKAALGPDMSTIIQTTADMIGDTITDKVPTATKTDDRDSEAKESNKESKPTDEAEVKKETEITKPKKNMLRSMASTGSID